MCAEGKPVSARDAFRLGIIDKIIEGDLLTGAVAFAREVADKPASKTRERHEKLGTSPENLIIFAAAREKARTKQRNLIAPLAAIDAVEASTQLSFEEGCQVEQKLFLECMFSEQSKALIHVFFGEREVAKIPEDHVIMTCVALGYPDDSFPANGVRSDRQPNSDFVRYVGFGD